MALDKLKIILADDDSDDREIFKLAISQLDINAELCLFENGLDLLNHLRDSHSNLPNFLFLDLNMPSMDGVECLRRIKGHPKLKGINVIIYSTSSSKKDIEKTFEEGANIYLSKPSDYSILKDSLKKILTLDWQCNTSMSNADSFLFNLKLDN